MQTETGINYITDRLHPDIATRLRQVPIIIDGEARHEFVVHHPLIVELVYHPEHINKLYEQKRELAERMRSQGRYRELLGIYERPYRLLTLMGWIADNVAPPDELRSMLSWAWIDAEDTDVAGTAELVRVFRELRSADGSPIVDSADTRIPQEPIEIYHGGESDDSMSWTTDRKTAEWFASRWRGDPKPLWAATVPPDGILALLSARSENEVVVDPEYLRDVRAVSSDIPADTGRPAKNE